MSTPFVDRRAPWADASAPGVSWSAVFAGAAAAAALSFLLLMLGVGLGLSAVSPWSNRGATAAAIGLSTVGWIAFTQIAASGLGGYMAGRLRTRWVTVHTDELFFRDTAHGMLAWAVATLVMAGLMASAVGSVLSGGAQVGAAAAGGATAAGAGAITAGASAERSGGRPGSGPADAGGGDPLGYWVDSLFRTDMPADAASAPAGEPPRGEVSRIMLNAVHAGSLGDDDRRYLAQLVARRTGLSQADAEKRVTDVETRSRKAIDDAAAKVKQASDEARKTAAATSLWMFVSLLAGAFFAALMATFGGRQRDAVVSRS